MRSAPFVLLALSLVACKGNAPVDSSTSAPGASPAAAPATAPLATGPGPGAAPTASTATPVRPPEQPRLTVSGKVLERIDLSSGMYLRLGTSSGDVWAAVNTANVKLGDTVTVVNAITMDGFESTSLKRKFDRIVFGALAGTADAKAPALQAGHGTAGTPPAAGAATAPKLAAGAEQGMPANMPPKMAEALARMQQAEQSGQAGAPGPMPQMPPGGMPMHPTVPVAPADASIKVEKADGANAYRIAEVYASRASLKDAPVVIRAKVVKFSPNIMGRNWVHLRDGSGSRAAQDDDLTVTTMDDATVGTVVVVKGIVRVNKDFGAGYAYPVIVEDAKIGKP